MMPEFSGYPYYLHDDQAFAQYWKDYFHEHSVEDRDSVGLYIDFPYCRSICKFCAFGASTIGGNRDEIQSYMQAVQNIAGACSGTYPEKLNNVYFGGGTPSMWDRSVLSEVIASIPGYLTTPIRTMEAHPADLTMNLIRDLERIYRVTTVSIGVQSFDPETCCNQNRTPVNVTSINNRVRMLQMSNLFVNIDLIALLDDPGEHGWEVFVNDLRIVSEIHPDDICLCVNFRNPNYYVESIRLRGLIRRFLQKHPEYNIEHPESLSLNYKHVIQYQEEVYHLRLADYHRRYRMGAPTVMTTDPAISERNTVIAFGGNKGHLALSFAGKKSELINSAYNPMTKKIFHTVTRRVPAGNYDESRIPDIRIGHIYIKGGEPMAITALINYYARLLKKGVVNEEELPPEHHDLIMEAYQKLLNPTDHAE